MEERIKSLEEDISRLRDSHMEFVGLACGIALTLSGCMAAAIMAIMESWYFGAAIAAIGVGLLGVVICSISMAFVLITVGMAKMELSLLRTLGLADKAPSEVSKPEA